MSLVIDSANEVMDGVFEFELTYEIDDGYVGGSRPQHLTVEVDIDHLRTLSTEQAEMVLHDILYDQILEDFQVNHGFCYHDDAEKILEFVAGGAGAEG